MVKGMTWKGATILFARILLTCDPQEKVTKITITKSFIFSYVQNNIWWIIMDSNSYLYEVEAYLQQKPASYIRTNLIIVPARFRFFL